MLTQEKSADPVDWAELQKTLHSAVDEMLEWLKTVRSRKSWQPIPQTIKDHFSYDWGSEGREISEIYSEFKEKILPYPSGNIHPRFWGWVNGTGIPADLLPELLIATMNSNVGGREHIANYVERQVIGWLKNLFGFPETASGIFTSGCSVANLIGLTIARNAKLPYNVRQEGMNSEFRPLYYGSSQVHSSIIKALEIIGVGNNQFRSIDVNNDFTIDTDQLQKQIEEDIDKGYTPVCIIGNAGTVNTGAVDNLEKLAVISEKYGLWFHVDGAFGAAAILSKSRQNLLEGINRADSLAFDLHKWFYIQYEIGCVLVKNERIHRETFSLRPDYLAEQKRGPGAGGHWFTEYGLQLSRNFKALKPWFVLQNLGKGHYSELIDGNISHANYLAQLVVESPNLELLAPVKLNIVCFRYFIPSISDEKLNEINEEILLRIQESGFAVPSSTKLNGKFSIRVSITNHRSRFRDFDDFIDRIKMIGKQVSKEFLDN